MFMKWGDPRRMAWLTTDIAGADSQSGFGSLYNNSGGPHIICVLQVLPNTQVAYVPTGMVMAQGMLSGDEFEPTPAFLGEATPVGLGIGGTVASPPTPNTLWIPSANPFNNTFGFPIVFLPPGWALTCYDSGTNEEVNLTFLYEWRWAWEFPNIPNDPNGLI